MSHKNTSKGFRVLAIIFAVLLSIAIILTIVGIAFSGKNVVMSLYSTHVDEELYHYWQARFRYEYLIYYGNGGASDTEGFWNRVKDEKTGLTYGEDCKKITETLIERIVISAYLYDMSGYTISDEYREKIKLVTEARTETGVFRGEKDYNAKAAQLGFDFNTYVEATVYELKADLLASMFVPTSSMQHEYYENNYVRVKLLFVDSDTLQSGDTANIVRAALENGLTTEQFDTLVGDPAYNNDTGSFDYTDGYYFAKGSAFADEYFTYRPTVKNAIFSLEKAGDWCEVAIDEEGDKGTLFIYRYDLPETPGYKEAKNNDFFTDMTRDAGDHYFLEWVNMYREDVVWDEEKKTLVPYTGYGTDVSLYMFFS